MTQEQEVPRTRKMSGPYRPWHKLQVVPNAKARVIKPGQISKDRARAIVATSQGVANEAQQKVAIEAILVDICGIHDISFRADEIGGERDTCFAEGKRYIASQILSLIKRQADTLKDN